MNFVKLSSMKIFFNPKAQIDIPGNNMFLMKTVRIGAACFCSPAKFACIH